jgi:hypothetical protein
MHYILSVESAIYVYVYVQQVQTRECAMIQPMYSFILYLGITVIFVVPGLPKSVDGAQYLLSLIVFSLLSSRFTTSALVWIYFIF